MNHVVAIVGMCGAGKSTVSDIFVKKRYAFVRFGQITLDIVKERGMEVNEHNEKLVREGLRHEHGMAAFATLNIPKCDTLLQEKNLVIDGLYSWSEYKVMKTHYGKRLFVVAVYSPPSERHERLSHRHSDKEDTDLRRRHFTKEEARSRDYAEIEHIERAGPIAMADYTIINAWDEQTLEENTNRIIDLIQNRS